jgi:hypothetical protein
MFAMFNFFYSMDMIELLRPCGFDTLEYSWVKPTIGIYTLADYFMAEWLFDQKDAFSQESSPSIYNEMDHEVRQIIWVAIAPEPIGREVQQWFSS